MLQRSEQLGLQRKRFLRSSLRTESTALVWVADLLREGSGALLNEFANQTYPETQTLFDWFQISNSLLHQSTADVSVASIAKTPKRKTKHIKTSSQSLSCKSQDFDWQATLTLLLNLAMFFSELCLACRRFPHVQKIRQSLF